MHRTFKSIAVKYVTAKSEVIGMIIIQPLKKGGFMGEVYRPSSPCPDRSFDVDHGFVNGPFAEQRSKDFLSALGYGGIKLFQGRNTVTPWVVMDISDDAHR